MSRRAVSELDTEPIPRANGPRHRLPRRGNRKRILVAGRVVGALVAVAVLAATAAGWSGYRNMSGGITTSQALVGGPESVGGSQNILIMGLDSRLDQHGQPLPQDIYDALHAGDETVGGYNSNVLILLHLPGGNGPVSAVSVPRDDYVDMPACPSGVCKGKVKQAYGLAYQQQMNSLSDTIAASSREQTAREAGRKAEIATVRRLLGVPIDHFIEVTLGAFFQIAQVVQPITVCLNDDTSDSYSGANFHRGVQQINASQAMAFVRQRRDENDQMFTDMDRTRRQQAFIVSLVTALRHGGALSNPADLRNLLRVAQQNIAVDDGFDLAGFVDHAAALTDSSLTLYTLPIKEFGQDTAGEDVNIVDVQGIRSIVHNLFTDGSTPATPTPTRTSSVPTTLDVINASNHTGLGSAIDYCATIGIAKTEAHNLALRNRLYEALKEYPKLRVVSSPAGKLASPLLSFVLPNALKATDTQLKLMNEHKVVVKVVPDNWFNGLRISTHLFNSDADVDALLSALRIVVG